MAVHALARLRSARRARVCGPEARRRLARDLEHAIRSRPAPGALHCSVPVDDRAVEAALVELEDLIGALRAPGPANRDGVDLSRRLLCDGASPLYAPDDP